MGSHCHRVWNKRWWWINTNLCQNGYGAKIWRTMNTLDETTTNKTYIYIYIYIYYWYARASACLYICLHAFELNCGFDRDYNLGSKIRPERDCQTRRTKRPQTWYLFVTFWTSWEVARRQVRKTSSETATHAIYLCALGAPEGIYIYIYIHIDVNSHVNKTTTEMISANNVSTASLFLARHFNPSLKPNLS